MAEAPLFTVCYCCESGVLETWWENVEGRRFDVKFFAPGRWLRVEE